MKLRLLGTFCAAAALAGCDVGNHGPTVIIDGWWNIDYAKNGCQGDRACESTNAVGALAFDNEVLTQFASQPGCNGVKVFHYTSPQTASGKAGNAMRRDNTWWLMVDFDADAPRQSWNLTAHSLKSPLFEGKDNPQELARRVCAILNASGAKVGQ